MKQTKVPLPPTFPRLPFLYFSFCPLLSGLEAATERIIILKYKTKQNKKQKKNERQNLVNTLFKISPHHRSLCKFTTPSFALSSLQLEFARANLSLICISVSLSSPSISLVERRKKIRPSIKSKPRKKGLRVHLSTLIWQLLTIITLVSFFSMVHCFLDPLADVINM